MKQVRPTQVKWVVENTHAHVLLNRRGRFWPMQVRQQAHAQQRPISTSDAAAIGALCSEQRRVVSVRERRRDKSIEQTCDNNTGSTRLSHAPRIGKVDSLTRTNQWCAEA